MSEIVRCDNPFCTMNYQAANGSFCVGSVMDSCQALNKYRVSQLRGKSANAMLLIYQQVINKIDDYFQYAYQGSSALDIKQHVMGLIDSLTENIKREMADVAERTADVH